jgi:hypothetical protein
MDIPVVTCSACLIPELFQKTGNEIFNKLVLMSAWLDLDVRMSVN